MSPRGNKEVWSSRLEHRKSARQHVFQSRRRTPTLAGIPLVAGGRREWVAVVTQGGQCLKECFGGRCLVRDTGRSSSREMLRVGRVLERTRGGRRLRKR